MSKPKDCEQCVHRPICEWCAEHTVEFVFPTEDGVCQMRNTDFDDIEEAVANAITLAEKRWDDAKKDTYDLTKAAFEKGRWCALREVFALMSTKGNFVRERKEK